MTRMRTFVDSGLLILAARGDHRLSQRAIDVLDAPDREYVTSDFVRLEVLPKAVYNRQLDEAEFYRAFFAGVHETVEPSAALVDQASAEAEQSGLSAIDALHVAAAKQARCDELVTTEKTTKPLFRVSGLKINTIRASSR